MDKKLVRLIDSNALYEELNEIGGCGAEKGTWAAGWDDAITQAIRLVENAPVYMSFSESVSNLDTGKDMK